MPRVIGFGVTIFVSLLLAGCALVDSSIESRVGRITNGYDRAFNGEILQNIVRGADFAPLRFFAHSKIVPNQTTDLKVGLPTATFGPGQMVAQKQFVFASNGTDNSASLSYELDPIETRDFHNSILTPINAGLIGLLLQNFPKEMVYLTVFDAIRYQEDGQPEIEYKNDPPPRPSPGCPAYTHCETFDPAYVPKDKGETTYYEPNGSIPNLADCRYERFLYWVELAIAYGLAADSHSVTNPKFDPNDKSGAQPKTILKGTLCFDSAQARIDLGGISDKAILPCEPQASTAPPAAKQNKTARTTTEAAISEGQSPNDQAVNDNITQFPVTCYPFRRGGKTVCIRIGFRMRSLSGIFTYLGKVMTAAMHGDKLVTLYNTSARSNGDTALFTARAATTTTDCFALAQSAQGDVCVPLVGADNTKRLFSLLAELVSLNQTASDIPASLTVHVGQ